MPKHPRNANLVEGSKSGNERTGEASFSNCFTRSDLQDFLIVPSSWNMDTGIGPTGLATDYCRQLTSCFAKAHTVADVFDRYDVKKHPSSRLKESVEPSGQSKTSWSETTFTISGFPNEPAM
jgi:hypothetical protein